MKLTKLLKGLFVPFLIFILVGNYCPEAEPKDCDPFKQTLNKTYKLNEHSLKSFKFKSNYAATKCKARFYVVFGWKDPAKFSANTERSPMDNSFAGLKLTFGEETYSKTFSSIGPIQTTGKSPYTGSSGYLWVIDIPVSAVSTSDDGTYFYVQIEHNILEEEFDFFVEPTIEFSDKD